MVKNFSLFLALRYLQPKRTFVSVITAISITGVMLGVGVLLVVIAVMAGFEKEFKGQLLQFEPHIIVKPGEAFASFDDQADDGWGDPMIDPSDPFGDKDDGQAPPPADPGSEPETESDLEHGRVEGEEDEGRGEEDSEEAFDFVKTPAHYWRDVKSELENAHPDIVLQCSPFIDARVVLGAAGGVQRKEACFMIGVDKYDEKQIMRLEELLVAGEFDLQDSNVVLSNVLANILGVGIGDSVDVYAPRMFDRILEIMKDVQDSNEDREAENIPGLEEFRRQLDDLDFGKVTSENREAILKSYRTTQQALRDRGVRAIEEKIDDVSLENELRVVGIFNSAQHENFAFMPLDVAQRMMYDDFGDNVHGLWVTTPDPFNVTGFRERILPNLHYTWTAQTWIDKWDRWFKIFANERAMMTFALLFIMIVAAFAIMNTMITVAVQKRREIGMMRSLGATARQVIGIFFYKGIIVGVIGVVLGTVFGLLVLQFRNEIRANLSNLFGWEIFPAHVFGVNQIPMQLESADVVWICVAAFLLSSFAAVIPAWFVTRLDPAKALRNA